MVEPRQPQYNPIQLLTGLCDSKGAGMHMEGTPLLD
jgi:hypothetical protein